MALNVSVYLKFLLRFPYYINKEKRSKNLGEMKRNLTNNFLNLSHFLGFFGKNS